MAQQARDAQIANNERARRRRQRQRRAARRRAQNMAAPRPINVSNTRFSRQHRHNIEAQNAGLRGLEEKIQESTVAETVALGSVFSEDLIRYCEAVVHPFGNEAIGAILPDRYQELVIPVTDRLELDITPDLFNLTGDWEEDTAVQLTAVFAWFQPRCLAAGLAGTIVATTSTNDDTYPRIPYVCVNDELAGIDQSGILNAYNLCFTGVWDVNVATHDLDAPVTYGLYNSQSQQAPTRVIQNSYYCIQYTRFSNIESNCDKMRVLGAGLKLWSEEAPINTGGFSVGGWITLEDIASAMELESPAVLGPDPSAATPGALKAIQPKIKFSCRSPGVKGATVRYSTLQTAEQTESEYPKIPSRMYDIAISVDEDFYRPGEYIVEQPNIDLATNDLITPGSFVPCIYWQFNSNTSRQAVNNAETYTIKMMSMVHSEGTPTGESPFMANKTAVDPGAQHAKQMLENVEVWPAATKGHSFKSFMKKARHVIAKVSHGVGKFTKLLALSDKFAETLM